MRLLFLALCCLPVATFGKDFTHRDFVLSTIERSSRLDKNYQYPFLTQLDIRKEQGVFLRSDGLLGFVVPQVVASDYDSSISHDLSDFYKSKNQRARIIVNNFLPGTNILISFGIDTGSNASKLSISRSYFMGLSGYKKTTKNMYFYFTSGVWMKQRTNERPCIDEYDREYWCPTLTAWVDKPSIEFKSSRFINMKATYYFN